MHQTNHLKLEVKDRSLLIYYQPANLNVIYDICDLNGNILLSGAFGKQQPTVCKMENMVNGDYQLCIIDGERILKKVFKY